MQNCTKKSILVFGDWFVDENWLVTKHNTYSSSHPGEAHYLSKNEYGKRMLSLCGAPEILELLNSTMKSCKFIGFGVWNKNDVGYLQCILCDKDKDSTKRKWELMSPYGIKGLDNVIKESTSSKSAPASTDMPIAILDSNDNDIDNLKRKCPYMNQSDCLYDQTLINLNKGNSSTNRIVRIYEGHGGGQPHLLHRFDWQLPIEELNYEKLSKKIKNIDDIVAIVVEDHNKGVVTKTSLETIIEALGDDKAKLVKWYIRSKVDEPSWMGTLKKEKIIIRLKVLDYKLALHKKGPRLWKYGKELGRSSLELLGELTGDQTFEHAKRKTERDLNTERIAILFDDNTVIAKDDETCYNLYLSPGSKQLINIGRTTVFFSSLIAQDILESDRNFGAQCDKALHCAYEWSKTASEAWNKENPHFYGDYKTALNFNPSSNLERKFPEISYKDSWNRWNMSSEKLGIIDEKEFQLWRGEGVISGYICVGGPKRNSVNEMVSSISQFNEQKNPKHPLHCLLVSSPGWGKSFLARSIANHFKMSYMEFSLSQMATSRDLVDCFDSICSHQNRTERKLLIFMDEINCKIEGNLAMGLLLSPIWDGSFIRDGKYYKLSPAVWIFASTESIRTLMKDSSNKGSDFLSRLNGPIVMLDSLKEDDADKSDKDLTKLLEQLKNKIVLNPDIDVGKDPSPYFSITGLLPPHIKTEQVYLGVYLLNKFWGPLSRIQEEVLQLFHDVVSINGVRSLEFFISKFQNIQRGIIYCSNVPLFENFPELKRHIILSANWRKTRPADRDNTLVNIKTLVE